MSVLSPLRYPGSKRQLASYVEEVLTLNNLRPRLFVEPFVGGASISLHLLRENAVENVAINDKDPLVASFWKTVFDDTDWLIEQIRNLSISLEQWDQFRHQEHRCRRSRALACIFLNRTSFSGILAPGAGPLGGRLQESSYQIDCRFNKDTVIQRISEVATYRDRIVLIDQRDWYQFINVIISEISAGEDLFFYFDPPFYYKADRLYSYYFDEQQHTDLRNALVALEHPWLLSYDIAESIIKMYSSNGHSSKQLDVIYSLAGSGTTKEAKEIIVTNLTKLPAQTRRWRSSKSMDRVNNN